MSTGFVEKEYTKFSSSSTQKIQSFLDDLRNVLNKHNVKLYSNECEVYINGQGYIGYLEDNIDSVDIVDGDETLYTSHKTKTLDA